MKEREVHRKIEFVGGDGRGIENVESWRSRFQRSAPLKCAEASW
jgi:hypothetical protein